VNRKYALNILEAASTFFEWGKPFAKPFFRENSSCVALFGGCDFSAAAQAPNISRPLPGLNETEESPPGHVSGSCVSLER